jgi:hypothetical protein
VTDTEQPQLYGYKRVIVTILPEQNYIAEPFYSEDICLPHTTE